jgi:hypothetical protein
MTTELYSDGIGEITITGPIVRIDVMSLSATERDEKNNPRPVFRQRIIMPVDAFANSVELMQKALAGLVQSGAVRQVPDPKAAGSTVSALRPNNSPNFS